LKKAFSKEQINKLKQRIFVSLNSIIATIYTTIIENLHFLILFSLFFSVLFSIFKTLFFYGYNVDSYQFFALSIEHFLRTGEQDYIFQNFYARNRIVYPTIIAILHIIFPFDISLLGCFINLIFALLSLFLTRKILKQLNMSVKSVDLFTLFSILSYNFINYWFNILTDFVGLFMFLCFVYYLILYIKEKNFFFFSYSIVFYILALFSREVYVLSIILYVFIIKSAKKRIIVSLTFIIIFLILLFTINEKLFFMKQIIPPAYWNLYISKQYWQLFLSLQFKWKEPNYLTNFFKGLLKVGILPTLLMIFVLNYKVLLVYFKDFLSRKPNILINWFILFSFIYTFFYSNKYSATGLRYWLPISWILLVFISKYITENDSKKILKVIFILYLTIIPFTWSIAELYVNRYAPSGTGSILDEGYYFNDMRDLKSISYYNDYFLEISLLNNTYFNTSIVHPYTDQEPSKPIAYSISFALWLNVSSKVTIILRMKSNSSASWGIALYNVTHNYYPGFGKEVYQLNKQNVFPYFHTHIVEVEGTFLLRTISLIINGKPGDSIIWDYLFIKVE